MKKLILSLMAISLILSSARADGGHKPLKLKELFCVLAGGTATGVVVKSAGGNGPATFLGFLLGGLIGADFCSWATDQNLAAQAAAFEKSLQLDDATCGQTYSWESSKYKGQLVILGENGWDKLSDRENDEINICKQFETTIYKKNEGNKYIGRTKAWACRKKIHNSAWVIAHDNQVEDKKYCGGSVSIDPGGSVSVGGSQGSVSIGDCDFYPPRPIDVGNVGVIPWSLDSYSRIVNDNGVMRRFMLAYRTRSSEGYGVGLGYMKAVSEDGRGVIIEGMESIPVSVSNVGIECRTSGLCENEFVTTRSQTAQGTIRFIFANGDVVVDDSSKGRKVVPQSDIIRGQTEILDNSYNGRATRLR